MKMKNTLLVAFVFVAAMASAQVTTTASTGAGSEKTLFERITKIEKKNEWFNAYLNLHSGFNAKFNQNGTGGFDNVFRTCLGPRDLARIVIAENGHFFAVVANFS